MTNYIVTAREVVVPLDTGGFAILGAGSGVPSNAVPASVTFLLAQDLIAEGDGAGGLAPTYAGDGGEVVTDQGPGEPAALTSLPIGSPDGASIVDDDSMPYWGTVSTLVLPDDASVHPVVFAMRQESDEKPTLMIAGRTGLNGISFGDGTDDPSNQAQITSQGGGSLRLIAWSNRGIVIEANSVEFIGRDDNPLIYLSGMTMNTDVEFSDPTQGPVLHDRTTGDAYRLVVDNGVLSVEAV